jgi:hypothetical protein
MGNVRNFAIAGRRHNAEGLLNADWGDKGHRNFLGASLHSFAHGAAHAWHGKAVDETRFTENFCYHVFGQKTNRLAETLKLLGNTYITCGKQSRNESLLYHALVEPLLSTKPLTRSSIDMMNPAGLQQLLIQLSDAKLWPELPKSIGPFEKLAFRELKLAARMDYLASRRALTVKDLRSSKNVKSSEILQLSGLMYDISKEFKELWLIRNKTSRLYDNLRLFKRIERESSRLSGKR